MARQGDLENEGKTAAVCAEGNHHYEARQQVRGQHLKGRSCNVVGAVHEREFARADLRKRIEMTYKSTGKQITFTNKEKSRVGQA